MRLCIYFMIMFMFYHITPLQALPDQCPKLDRETLNTHKAEFPIGKQKAKELVLGEYGWKIIDAQNLEKNLTIPANVSPFVFSASRPGITTHVNYVPSKGKLKCTYDFKLKDQVVARVTLQAEHGYERWKEVPGQAAKALEQEEEQEKKLSPHFRIRAE